MPYKQDTDYDVSVWETANQFRLFYGGPNVGDRLFECVKLPQELRRIFPELRVNYFTVNWGASVMGRGCILLDSESLYLLESDGVHDDPRGGRLVFMAFENGKEIKADKGVGDDTWSPWMEFHHIYMDRAVPLYGQHSTEFDLGGDYFGDAPDDFQGLWLVYLTDERAIRRYFPVTKAFNVRDYANRRFWSSTCKTVGETKRPYTFQEVLDELFLDYFSDLTQAQKDNYRLSLEGPPFEFNIPENLSFLSIPSGFAIDVVAHQLGNVFRIDHRVPITDDSSIQYKRYRLGLWGIGYRNVDVVLFLSKSKHLRITGGSVRRYAKVNLPDKYRVVWHEVRDSGVFVLDPARPSFFLTKFDELSFPKTYLGEPKVGTKQTVHTNNKFWEGRNKTEDSSGEIVVSQVQQHELIPADIVFSGWLVSFLELNSCSTITYSLDGDVPRTSIKVGNETPLGIIMRERQNSINRGESVPVAIQTNNSISWEMGQEGIFYLRQQPLWFVGKIISRSVNTDGSGGNNLGIVRPIIETEENWFNIRPFDAIVSNSESENVTVWLGYETWLEVGDVVLCFYSSLRTPRWIAIGLPPVRVPDKYCHPDTSCICDTTDNCPPCSHSSQTTDQEKILPETYNENLSE